MVLTCFYNIFCSAKKKTPFLYLPRQDPLPLIRVSHLLHFASQLLLAYHRVMIWLEISLFFLPLSIFFASQLLLAYHRVMTWNSSMYKYIARFGLVRICIHVTSSLWHVQKFSMCKSNMDVHNRLTHGCIQRLFDASSDSDIPKNVPFTLVINTLLTHGCIQ